MNKENLKTISYLNSKFWYRALKVVIVGVAVLIFAVGEYFLYENYKSYPSNYEKSRITCNNTSDRKSFDVKKKDYGLNNPPFSEDVINAVAMKFCGEQVPITPTIEPVIKTVDKNGTSFRILSGFIPENYDYLLIHNSVFSASHSIMEEGLEWGPFLKDSFLTVLYILLAIEILRRIFYYVVIGTFRPNK
jgi:hypothetical protein